MFILTCSHRRLRISVAARGLSSTREQALLIFSMLDKAEELMVPLAKFCAELQGVWPGEEQSAVATEDWGGGLIFNRAPALRRRAFFFFFFFGIVAQKDEAGIATRAWPCASSGGWGRNPRLCLGALERGPGVRSWGGRTACRLYSIYVIKDALSRSHLRYGPRLHISCTCTAGLRLPRYPAISKVYLCTASWLG
jgi:hypothetical protein